MTTGFQQQGPSVNFVIPKTAATPQQVGKKLPAKPEPSQLPAEKTTFK
jgi:hypothetical protein